MPDESSRIQIAQGGDGFQVNKSPTSVGEKGHAETHAGTEHEEYKLGDIPSPHILFWNGIIVAVFLIAFAKVVTRHLKAIPGTAQNFAEYITEGMISFTRGIIGDGGEKYVPLVGTIFYFILFGNLIGQIPYFNSPTANLSMTLALGLIVFIYVQYVGIKSVGAVGYIKHFMGPMPALSPLLFPVEVISEIVKPFTLAMRLFGNIFGEDTVIIVLAGLAVQILPKYPVIPLQFPILILGLLTAFVQALVFSLLTCIYISLQSHHDSEHDGQVHHGGEGHPGIEESGLVP